MTHTDTVSMSCISVRARGMLFTLINHCGTFLYEDSSCTVRNDVYRVAYYIIMTSSLSTRV